MIIPINVEDNMDIACAQKDILRKVQINVTAEISGKRKEVKD